MFRLMLTLTAALVLAGCSSAQKSSQINADYVPTSSYLSMTCSSLTAEARRLRQRISQLRGDVDEAYNDDKTMEIVTWVLFWPAAFAMDGNDTEAQKLASAKGEAEAIGAAMRQKNCS